MLKNAPAYLVKTEPMTSIDRVITAKGHEVIEDHRERQKAREDNGLHLVKTHRDNARLKKMTFAEYMEKHRPGWIHDSKKGRARIIKNIIKKNWIK